MTEERGKPRAARPRKQVAKIDRLPPSPAELILRAGDKAVRLDLAQALEVIEWMGGASVFAPEGKARRGWLRAAVPLLEKYGMRVGR
jgi:hypothetical protein